MIKKNLWNLFNKILIINNTFQEIDQERINNNLILMFIMMMMMKITFQKRNLWLVVKIKMMILKKLRNI